MLRPAIVLVALVAACSNSGQRLPADVAEVDVVQKLRAGDNPAWAATQLDETGFSPVRLDLPLPQGEARLSERGYGWYRIRFRVQRGRPDLAVHLGVVGTADETFLNGTRIGGEGAMGKRFVETHTIERAYDLPPSLLVDGENVLAVRVMNAAYSFGIQGPVLIGTSRLIEQIRARRQQNWVAADSAASVLWLLTTVGWLVLFLVGARGRPMGWIGLLCFAATTTVILGHSSLYLANLKTHAINLAHVSAFYLSPAAHVIATGRFLNARPVWLVRTLASLSAISALGWLLLPSEPTVLFRVSACIAALHLPALNYWLWKARHNREGLAGVAVSVGCTLCIYLVDAVGGWTGLSSVSLSALQHGLMLGTVTGVLFAVAQRFVTDRQNAELAPALAVAAGARERKRIARDLHDGVAQDIAAMTLRLEIAADEVSPDARPVLEATSRQLHRIGEGLRSVGRTLHQESLLPLPQRLRALCGGAGNATTTVTFESTEGIRHELQNLPEGADLEIFLICREAVKNACSHAAATHVAVKIVSLSDGVLVEVRDDGRGFDPIRTEDASGGIGLRTMKERAHTLAAELSVVSGPSGTSVCVSIPTARRL